MERSGVAGDAAPVLTSVRNPRVLAAAELHRSRERRERGLHLAEGRRVVEEALAAGLVTDLFATAAHDDLTGPGLGTVVDERVMRRLSDATTPPGVVAVVRTPDLGAALPSGGAVLVLDALGDPGNVGTLVRSAAAFGLPVVVTGDGADPFGPKAVRGSAGACYRATVLRRTSFAEAEVELRAGGRRVLALAADGGLDVGSLRSGDAVVLVLGAEPRGLGADVRRRCDDAVRIPMRSGVESLNVAVAGSIVMHRVAGDGDLGGPRGG